LSARQRSAFILFDGVKTDAQVLALAGGLGVTSDDIEHLVAQGFLQGTPDAVLASGSSVGAASSPTPLQVSPPLSGRSEQERYSAAMPIATKLTASLGLRGFRLNLAVEAASGFDDLLALLPRIKQAVGNQSCAELERTLRA
jgi:hypothetical protein